MVISNEVHKAMILAAGEGTRLRPLTLETPKVLLAIDEKPLIRYTISWLKSHGITEVAINLWHLGDDIKNLLSDGSRFGLNISYSFEETLLGTAGGVKRMEHFFDDTFVVIYGDILTDFDLNKMISFHQRREAVATLALFEVSNPTEVGIVEIDEMGRILSFVEKPPSGSETSNLASGAVYVLNKEIFNYIPGGVACDFAYDILPKLIKFGLPVYGYILQPEDYLIDIGTLEKYQQANEDVKAGKVKISYESKSYISR